MTIVETKLLIEPWDVDRRLSEMRLLRPKLLKVRDIALHESANATPFHPANAAGTFAYQHGTWALRDGHVGHDEWVEDRVEGVEAIRHERLKLKVAFSNVDLACDRNHMPKPRSRKGAGAERASVGTLFDSLPQYAPQPLPSGWALYYVMVDERGAVELTRPVVKGGTFVAPIERLFLSDGGDFEKPSLGEDDDIADDFDPQIARKLN
jgi:hypothetical protein